MVIKVSKVVFENYTVLNNKKLDTKIVLISDLHYYDHNNMPIFNLVINEIEKINPDYICIPGDFIDGSTVYSEELFLGWLTNLGKICPIIMSYGNHDVKNKGNKTENRNNQLLDKITKIHNMHLLDNEIYEVNNIRFIGLTLPAKSYDEEHISIKCTKKQIETYFNEELKHDKYNILLAHSPLAILKHKIEELPFIKSIDLILSGHTHGGLTPKWLSLVLVNRGLVSPMKHLLTKYEKGYIKEKRTIVSSGITKFSKVNPFHAFNRFTTSEITEINIKSS